MDGITYPAAAIRRVKSAIRKTGATQVTLGEPADGAVQFQGLNGDGKVRVAGVVDAEGEVSFTTKPKVTKKAPKKDAESQAAEDAAGE